MILTIGESKDASAADYTVKLFADGNAVQQLIQSSPDAAQSFAATLRKLKSAAETNTASAGGNVRTIAPEQTAAYMQKLKQAEALWAAQLEESGQSYQSGNKSALKGGRDGGIIEKIRGLEKLRVRGKTKSILNTGSRADALKSVDNLLSNIKPKVKSFLRVIQIVIMIFPSSR